MRPGLPFNASTILLFPKSCIFPFSILLVITLSFNFLQQSSETVETMTKLLDLAGYVFSFLCPSLSLIVHLSSYDKVSADTACSYLLFVTDTTDGVCVKKIARCKFLQI